MLGRVGAVVVVESGFWEVQVVGFEEEQVRRLVGDEQVEGQVGMVVEGLWEVEVGAL